MECDFHYPNSNEVTDKFYWIWYKNVLTTSLRGTKEIENTPGTSHYNLYKSFTLGGKEYSYVKDLSGLNLEKNMWFIRSKIKFTNFFPKEWLILGATKDSTTFEADAYCTQENIDDNLNKLSDHDKQDYIRHIEAMKYNITTDPHFTGY